MWREKTQVSKIRNEKWKITNNKVIQRIIKEYFENIYSYKLENTEMDKFLDMYDHANLNQKDINHQNRSIIHDKIEAAIVSQKENPGPDGYSTEFYQTFKEELIPTLLNLRKGRNTAYHTL
jgi:hypothetical protein